MTSSLSKQEVKSGRLGHFVKKKSKDQKKFVPTEPVRTAAEEEHDEMLRVAKVMFLRCAV